MQGSARPGFISTPFASAQIGGPLFNVIPGTTGVSGNASFLEGFTSVNDTPVASGGIPPRIGDFNGLFNIATAWDQWQQVGGAVFWDSGFSAEIGGYPSGALLRTSTPNLFYLSTADNNITNPTTGGAGWLTLKMIPNFIPVAPQVAYQNIDLRGGGGANQTYSFTLGFTAPCAGFAHADSAILYAELPAANAGPNSGVVLSGSGTSNNANTATGGPGPGSGFPATSFAVCQCAAGATVLATFQTTFQATPPGCQWQQNGKLIFVPTP
jgi:hypothetical protein